MNYILFDDSSRTDLLPLTFTRPVADIRIGILTIREKWEKYLKAKTSTLTERYLSEKYPMVKAENSILINGSILPNKELVKLILALKPEETLVCKDYIIALHVTEKDLDITENLESSRVEEVDKRDGEGPKEVITDIPHIKINYPWDIFSLNGEVLIQDFKLITSGRKSAEAGPSNRIFGHKNLFIEPGAHIFDCSINAETGPVYIGKGAEIMEGASIRGPFALCDHGVVRMGTKIYGTTTIGPFCKIGGEITNCIFFGYSNKAHDGFFGDSVIGEWCNIGADSNTSNLKNTYDSVKMWNYTNAKFIMTAHQFCGLIMGDHSKCGINTMFNTGTVVGVNANIFGSGFQRNFIPSFSWGSSAAGYTTYDLDKAIEVAKIVYGRRDKELTQEDIAILTDVYDQTFAYRKKKI